MAAVEVAKTGRPWSSGALVSGAFLTRSGGKRASVGSGLFVSTNCLSLPASGAAVAAHWGRVARDACPTVASHSRIRGMLLAARSAALPQSSLTGLSAAYLRSASGSG